MEEACVPGLAWRPALHAEGGSNGVRLPAEAWPLIAAVNGEQSIGEIAAQLDYDCNNTVLAFLWLAKRGLVTFRPPRRRSVIRPLAARHTYAH